MLYHSLDPRLSILLLYTSCLHGGMSNTCPNKCACSGSTMQCYSVMPSWVPASVTNITAYGTSLKYLNLTHVGWANVLHLSINPGESVFQKMEETYKTLYEYDFKRLQNLEYLQIACRCLRDIRMNTFYGLNKLRTLDLSNNEALGVRSIEDALIGVDILPKLSELFLSNVSVHDYEDFMIGTRFLDAVRNKPLKVLDLSRTTRAWFQRINKNEFIYSFPFLEKLNISEAGIAAGSLVRYSPPFPNFRQLKCFDFSYQSPTLQLTENKLGNRFTSPVSFVLSSKLTELYARRIQSSPTEVYSKSPFCLSIKVVHLERSLSICFDGKPEPTKVSFAENSIFNIDPNITTALGINLSLRELDLSKNNLGDAFAQKGYARSLLDLLITIEVLSVSENGIYEIPGDTFINARRLQVLDLSKNKLRTVIFSTQHLISLRKLDISNNQIRFVDDASISHLQHLQNYNKINRNKTSETIINLAGNGFVCACENSKFFDWLLTLDEAYTCLQDSEEYQIDEEFMNVKLQHICHETTMIIVFVTFSSVIAVLAFISAYLTIKERKRLSLKQKTNKGIEMYALKKEQHPPVFLSFSSADERIIMEEIYPKLEEGLKKVLNTDSRCVSIGDRDFRPGLSLANEIIRCVEESSVVVFFITNSFCKKMWCRNEALVAHYENKPTVLMMWENVDTKLMPKHLYKHFREYARVHWVHENGHRVMRPDWDVLCESIVGLFTVLEAR